MVACSEKKQAIVSNMEMDFHEWRSTVQTYTIPRDYHFPDPSDTKKFITFIHFHGVFTYLILCLSGGWMNK